MTTTRVSAAAKISEKKFIQVTTRNRETIEMRMQARMVVVSARKSGSPLPKGARGGRVAGRESLCDADAFQQHANGQEPAIDEDKQQEFERK